jgi:integrase
MRSGEAAHLKWIDIDDERRIITLNAPEKGSNPRMWKVSMKLINMLAALPKKRELVFGNPNPRVIRSIYCGM